MFLLGIRMRAMALEKVVQNNLIDLFKRMGYTHERGENGKEINLIGRAPRLDEVFKREIERLNSETLGGATLSETEFERLRNQYPKDHVEAFSKLRNGVTIYLDNNKQVNIKFLDRENFQNNTFQITDEITVKGMKRVRLDLLVLINGIPIANIELKKAGIKNGVEEAIAQINRYSSDSIYQQDLLKFVQLFVASDSVKTKYFSVDPRVSRGKSYG